MSFNIEQFKKDKEKLDLLKDIEEGNKILNNFKREDAIDFIEKQKFENAETNITNINTQFIPYNQASDNMLKDKIYEIISILQAKFVSKAGE
ncbi:hypothetical protein [[Clostridium] colinum]|uniref:hypothetical protein n=1 Tax=[Clostridium] colinum TaxID=36835 RepID=UPI0020248E6D|nr:hypothetical protein [[Clostridium] colinum]